MLKKKAACNKGNTRKISAQMKKPEAKNVQDQNKSQLLVCF